MIECTSKVDDDNELYLLKIRNKMNQFKREFIQEVDLQEKLKYKNKLSYCKECKDNNGCDYCRILVRECLLFSKLKDWISFGSEPTYKFEFGKYEGRFVSDILDEDEDYCINFVSNVVGRSENTLYIIDFIYKKINDKLFFTKSEAINNVIQILSEFIDTNIIKVSEDLIISYVDDWFKEKVDERFI